MNNDSSKEYMVHSDFRVTEAVARQFGVRRFPIGTIICPKRGGAIATNKQRRLGVSAGLDLNLMGVTAEHIQQDYLWLWVQGLDLATISNGSNVPQINHSDIEPLIVSVSTTRNPNEIVRVLSRDFERIWATEQQARRAASFLDRLDQASLDKAFRGELVPQEPETASEKATSVADRCPMS